MPTNVFFNNFTNSMEQNLIENLIVESIKIFGHDVYYLPRSLINKDEIYGEDSISEYKDSYFVEVYIKNVSGFGGEGDFLSKFNIQLRDQVTFSIANKTFYDEIGSQHSILRPREGDLIYLPLTKSIYVIQFVEHEAIFYQMGSLQIFDLQCELWEYSNEKLNTGITEVDSREEIYSFDLSSYRMLTQNSFVITDEDGFDLVQEQFNYINKVGDSLEDNSEIETEANAILDFSELDPFSENTW